TVFPPARAAPRLAASIIPLAPPEQMMKSRLPVKDLDHVVNRRPSSTASWQYRANRTAASARALPPASSGVRPPARRTRSSPRATCSPAAARAGDRAEPEKTTVLRRFARRGLSAGARYWDRIRSALAVGLFRNSIFRNGKG